MKKGFSLIFAIMTVLILSIVAVGFFSIANYTTNTASKNSEAIKTYWASESASNYNINWWINLPDSVRKLWNVEYTVTELSSKAENVFFDTDLKSFDVSSMPEMKDKIDGNYIWMHASCLEKPNVVTIDGKDIILMRYKAPRKDENKQAVWVLDSYAYNSETSTLSEIMISNVYNYIAINDIGWLDYAEALNHSMYGTGINSRKGVYYEWDYRHGQCYFNDMIRFDYKSGSSKKGPTFYGKFHTASENVSCYGASVNSPKEFTDLTTDYSYGIFAESTDFSSQADAISDTFSTGGGGGGGGGTAYGIASSIKGGYEIVEPMEVDDVVWSWDDVVEYGEENGVYFLPKDKFSAGDYIDIRTRVESGKTYIDIYKSIDASKPTIKGLDASKYSSVAVEGIYGDVGIRGTSNTDFTVVTQSNNIHINGDFYLYEMKGVKADLEGSSAGITDADRESPSEEILNMLSEKMTSIDPQGHLSLIACLDSKGSSTTSRENVFFVNSEETLFMTAAMLSYEGDVAAGPRVGTSQNNALNFYNIGSVIILDTQSEATGTNSSKFPYVLVQDKRYLDPNEPIPPIWGEGPGDHLTESTQGLNPGHKWNKLSYSNVDNIDVAKKISYRFFR